jgi:hypothetical protein
MQTKRQLKALKVAISHYIEINFSIGVGDAYLALVMDIVKNIDDRIEEAALQLKYNRQELATKAPEKVSAYNMNDWQIFRLIMELSNDVPPHPSQLLWCDSKITKTTLKYFLQRVRHFTHLPYIIIGVNQLQLSVRERLLDWISGLYVEQEQADMGPLYLVFTEHVGVEVFSFLKDQQKNEANIPSANQLLANNFVNSAAVRKQRNIRAFECVYGDPCSGKSHFIKHQIKTLQVRHVKYANSNSCLVTEQN